MVVRVVGDVVVGGFVEAVMACVVVVGLVVVVVDFEVVVVAVVVGFGVVVVAVVVDFGVVVGSVVVEVDG